MALYVESDNENIVLRFDFWSMLLALRKSVTIPFSQVASISLGEARRRKKTIRAAGGYLPKVFQTGYYRVHSEGAWYKEFWYVTKPYFSDAVTIMMRNGNRYVFSNTDHSLWYSIQSQLTSKKSNHASS